MLSLFRLNQNPTHQQCEARQRTASLLFVFSRAVCCYVCCLVCTTRLSGLLCR